MVANRANALKSTAPRKRAHLIATARVGRAAIEHPLAAWPEGAQVAWLEAPGHALLLCDCLHRSLSLHAGRHTRRPGRGRR